jgi:tetratricopeptide (TPR) repeat protein
LALARLYRYSANLDRFYSRLDAAISKYGAATGLLDDVVGKFSEDELVLEQLAETLRDWSSVLRDSGRLETARDQLTRANDVVARLRSGDPENLDHVRTEGINSMELALVMLDMNLKSEAIQESEKTVKLLGKLREDENHGQVDELLFLLASECQGQVCRHFGQLEQARSVLAAAREYAEAQLPNHSSLGSRHVHALVLLQLARVRKDQGKPSEEMIQLLESAIEKWNTVIEQSNAPRYRRYAALAKALQAREEVRSDNGAAGKKLIDEALEALAAEEIDESTGVSALEMFADISHSVSLACRDLGNDDLADEQLLNAIDFLENASQRCPENSRLKSLMEAMKNSQDRPPQTRENSHAKIEN